MTRVGILLALTIACGDSPREITPPPAPPGPSHLEQTIATQLSATLGRQVTVACSKTTCRADLGDASLPITIAKGSGDVAWSVDGLLVRAQPIEAYLRDALADLGASQRVSCGPAIRSVTPGTRLECALERGGKAFAVIAADGSFSTEIDLDPAAAEARSKEVSNLSTGSAGSADEADD